MREFTPPGITAQESSGITSPCVRNCCLDEQDVCLGCGRLLSEILVWREVSATERETICALAVERLAARERWTRGI